MPGQPKPPRLRSQQWFDDADNIGMSAMYLERYFNFGLTPEELRSGRPIIGIAQTGSELSPCNYIHTQLASRIRDGIRDAGGVPIIFPVHPIHEQGRRPTAALDRNLAYLALTEILHGYPFDGVVLTTGCDKTTPACVMAVSTLDIPAIVLSGGPMLDAYWQGRLAGSGTTHWEARKLYATGGLDDAGYIDLGVSQVPSTGHCNTMGTALTMNALAETLGLSLPGCASIPAPYRERQTMAYKTGCEAVRMVERDIRPSALITRGSIINAIRMTTALGGSTNAQVHISAIARHAHVPIDPADWQTYGYDVPNVVNMQPAGAWLGEAFHRAGGVPAVLWELREAGLLNTECATVDGGTIGARARETSDRRVVFPHTKPLMKSAGFAVLSGNLFDFAIMKTSTIDADFRRRYLSDPDTPGVFTARAIVFDGSQDYHDRIEDPALEIDEHCILVMRQAGPIGWPGSAEVVNMQPPASLLERGINSLPTLGDGRQSGTSGSPSILHCVPEAAEGGPLAYLQTGDLLRIDIPGRRVDHLVPAAEFEQRKAATTLPPLENQSPWQSLYRSTVGPLSTGGCMELAVEFEQLAKVIAKHNH